MSERKVVQAESPQMVCITVGEGTHCRTCYQWHRLAALGSVLDEMTRDLESNADMRAELWEGRERIIRAIKAWRVKG